MQRLTWKLAGQVFALHLVLFLVIAAIVFAPTILDFLGFPRRGCVRTYRSICPANLRQIDGAINTWALENEKTTNDIPTFSDIIGTNKYIKVMPQCAPGASYIFGHVGERPRCSIADHNVWPEDREQR